ncbi:hypothetical protein BX285_5271 [Streptomyces sp. 1114.5]|nr:MULTISPECIES: hypothetical protein [unclassified Streptomyces]RKT11323.1 hypothetical protein BX285_5271 [Streptomyces sp. 1114.5]SOB81339.1 hypothetical protein SAMN06272789_1466 [Streptomyces sp. 1331.2]
MELRSQARVEHRNATAQVTLTGGRDEEIVIPGTCCCSAAIVRES